jgi:hypothetical protein
VTGNVNLGATSTPTVTDTPTNLRFDNGYSATAGKTKSKLFLYRDASEIIHGFGVSAGATDYYSASYHDFHLGDTRTLRIQADSVIFGASSVVWHSGNLTGDQTGHNHDGRHLKLSGGTLTGPLAVGNLTTPTATDTPTTVTFDRTYSTTPGKTKCKLFLYRDVDNNIHGLGVSAASTDYHSVAYHKFYAGDNIILQAQPGVVSIGNTAADPASTATPTKLLLDRTYSNGSTKDKCKIVMLEGTDGSIYGFSCGANYDNQYHSQRQHDFYGDNNLEVRINREGISIPSITSSGSGSAVRIDSNGLLTKDTSSIRYKENVVSNINTEWLYDIQVCQYDRKDGSTKGEVGIIAEELALIKPELVTFDKDGRIDGYNKIDLIPVLINEVQRLRKEIEILKDRI